MRQGVLFFFCLILGGCGYRWQSENRPTVTVPFVSGDEDGALTNEIVRALSASGLYEVRHRCGDYRLQVSIAASDIETIGYRRDRQKITGEIKKNLVGSEGRRILSAEATLFEGDSDEIAFGPFQIATAVDYDYVDGDSVQDLAFVNSSGVLITVLPFSLGQLEPVDSAQEAATRPLYARLAQKIVDVISAEW